MLQDDFEGGEVFIVYFLYWKMTHDSVIQQQLFCLQPFEAWRANKGSMKKIQWLGGNYKESWGKGEGQTETDGRSFNKPKLIHPSLTFCHVFCGTSIAFVLMMAKSPPTSAFERQEGDRLVEDSSDYCLGPFRLSAFEFWLKCHGPLQLLQRLLLSEFSTKPCHISHTNNIIYLQLVISHIPIDIPLCYVGALWGLECRSDTCCCTLEIVLSQHLQIESVLWKSRKIATCFGLKKELQPTLFRKVKWFKDSAR